MQREGELQVIPQNQILQISLVPNKRATPTKGTTAQRVTFANYAPLQGFVFYLDIPPDEKAKKIAQAVNALGGRIEPFLNVNVTDVITSRVIPPPSPNPDPTTIAFSPPNAATFAGKQMPLQSQLPLPANSFLGGPFYSTQLSPVAMHGSATPNALPTFYAAMGKRKRSSPDEISGPSKENVVMMEDFLTLAAKAGKNIHHVSKFTHWINALLVKADISRQQAATKAKIPAQARPNNVHYIRVEDTTGTLEPWDHTFLPDKNNISSLPRLNFESPLHFSPFLQMTAAQAAAAASAKETKVAVEEQDATFKKGLKTREKDIFEISKKSGYCECCSAKYSSLEEHLATPKHRAFALADINYTEIDQFISSL
eukprot:TRINITY_DN10165_c0_g1_i1.p1 TRINITY_DN10165_c0_g1~~TRINITY_DN10165_c0_g1_i1.p1  ORF type:complete len:369 (+),score=59.27 TRINITY_DN10165_c0_g1_i1:122-1228(+)